MLVRPLKKAAGRWNFGPGDPAFDVSDADAKELVAAGAVEPVEPRLSKRGRSSGSEKADGSDGGPGSE